MLLQLISWVTWKATDFEWHEEDPLCNSSRQLHKGSATHLHNPTDMARVFKGRKVDWSLGQVFCWVAVQALRFPWFISYCCCGYEQYPTRRILWEEELAWPLAWGYSLPWWERWTHRNTRKLLTVYLKPEAECDDCRSSPCFPAPSPLLYSLGRQPVCRVSIPSSVKSLWACQNRSFFDNVKST